MQRKMSFSPRKAAKKRGLSPSLLRTSPDDLSASAMQMHVLTFDVDDATCKMVFPFLFIIRRPFLSNWEIISTSSSTMSSGAMDTAKCNAVSPNSLILALQALNVCFLYISTTSFHSPPMVYLYKLSMEKSPSTSSILVEQLAIFSLTAWKNEEEY